MSVGRRFLWGLLGLLAAAATVRAESADPRETKKTVVVVVTGASGAAEYRDRFAAQATHWSMLGERAGWSVRPIDLDRVDGVGDPAADRLNRLLSDLADGPPDELVVILVGHGTHDGRTARFNVPGPDLTAESLNEWLDRVDCRQLLINTTAASGPWIVTLARPGRVVVTATKNGREVDVTRLGDALTSLIDPDGGGLRLAPLDRDKDDAVSLLELTVELADRTAAAYRDDNRIATEHALIDDNGDGRGTRLDAFAGAELRADVEAGRSGEANPDGALARDWIVATLADHPPLTDAQRDRRREYEAELAAVKARRPERVTEDYLRELEAVFRKLATVYRPADPMGQPGTPSRQP